jgi:DNA mismatch endonuclease (patch repair protein)
VDVMKPEQRRRAMASNRGRTGPEKALAKALWRRGLRYLTSDGYARVYGRKLLGQPDLVLPRKRLIIFVDGCFWHGCPDCGRSPGQSGEFWRTKIAGNVERDRRVTASLEKEGWTVIRVPEHALRTKGEFEETVGTLTDRVVGEKSGDPLSVD